MKLGNKESMLERKVSGAIKPYFEGRYLEVVRTVRETAEKDSPLANMQRYSLGLTQDYRNKGVTFFNVETTGILANSPVNMVTLGQIGKEDLTTRTFFALDYYGERQIIKKSLGILRGAKFLVSYNGKSFHLPRFLKRLETFGICQTIDLAKLKEDFSKKHIDLSQTLPSKDRKITSLETTLFEYNRRVHLIGQEISSAYWEFVYAPQTDGQLENITSNAAKIIEKNISDNQSIASILGYLINKGKIELK